MPADLATAPTASVSRQARARPTGLWPTAAAICLAASANAAAQDDRRPFRAEDLVTANRLSSTTVSPVGDRAVYVLRTTDLEANRGRTDLWLVDLSQSLQPPRPLTHHEASDFEPVWAPDGRGLYFLSTRSGSSQVWHLDLDGGEARQITDLPLDVANLRLGPDGENLAFSMEVFPDCADLRCTTDRLEHRRASGESGVVYDQLFVRHWDGWKDGRRSHLFTLRLDEQLAGTTPQPVDLMAGLDADAPSKPFGGREEYCFTPDGESVVFTARAAPDASGSAEAWSTNFDLWIAPVDGSEPPRNLTPTNPAWDTQPQFSPAGDALYYLAMQRPGYESDRLALMRLAWPSGQKAAAAAIEIAPGWDRSIGGFEIAADGSTVFATAGDVGETGLFAIDASTGAVRRVLEHGSGTVRAIAATADRLLFEHQDLARPGDLWSLSLAEVATQDAPRTVESARRHTEVNRELEAAIAWGDWDQFSFAGWNDESVHGYVVWPTVGKRPASGWPVAFIVHGGPQGSSSNNFHYRWNPQTYVGAGYAVVMIDFHGSTGYGQAFTDSIRDDWGGKPLEDLQKGLAAALQRYDFLDGERVCALGASYGGYMMNWIAGNWPDRFRCLVNHDGLFDNRSMYFATEELWFPEWDHHGGYLDNPDGHEKHNPVNFADRWKTPMLVVHGELDYRVPITQGLATFTALQRRGIPSRLLYFPDENHWVLKPKNSLQWHREVERWLGEWLGRR
ncbi:MAG: S9 family peptidase [Acidobacteria bacterium]|nr:MAG: S9 family peptidase [Acidobacteriota bacterium]REK11303.1 MAG: S9 family peptidase [Acidobacteriota bacterium]